MYKKTTLSVLASVLILTGCGGVKEEFQKGYSLYEKGDFESLLESKKFFNDYKEKNPGDDNVDKYMNLVDKAIIEKTKELTMSSYEGKEIEKAWEYIQIAKAADPKDEEIQEAYATVKNSYDEQMIYNDFASYLEDIYIKMKVIPDTWDMKMKQYEVGQIKIEELLATSKNLYLSIVDIRKSIGDKSFELVSEKTKPFQDANTYLFDYAVNLEAELSKVATLDLNADTDFIENLNQILPKTFSKTFLETQKLTSSFVTEVDFEGEPVKNIKDTLNFNKALEKHNEVKNNATTDADANTNTNE